MILMNKEEIKERQQEATNRFRNIKILAKDFYLHWYNNYYTTELIAEHYEITNQLAIELIDMGREINNGTYFYDDYAEERSQK